MPPPCPIFVINPPSKMEANSHEASSQSDPFNHPPCSNGAPQQGIDPQLWHACAGGMVQLPLVGSKVIYFPQGHAEHAASSADLPSSLAGLSTTILCSVMAVQYLADAETDEVYTRIRLRPELGAPIDMATEAPPPPLPSEKPNFFAKTLTQSDANNGGGFSVPRYCADTIFPRLDYTADPPVQNVLAKDVHGELWKFRHIYRGTPRRHLLTTGWSNFVNQKKLVAGDAIVFLRSASGELCVGVRRSTRGAGGGDSCTWHLPGAGAAAHRAARWEVKGSDNSLNFLDGEVGGRMARPGSASTTNTSRNFARNRPRVTAKSILEAVTLAAARQPFEVVYYPRATISEFCVKADAVKAALQQRWVPGMRFKMPFETEDSSRVSWFMGTISKVQEADPVRWPNSPWKMLQVSWDEPDLLQGVTRVSPWQVELVSPMQLPPFSLPKKKLRVSQPLELQLNGQDIMGLTMATFANNVLGQMNPWHGFTESFPAGMQGARHDRLYGPPLQNILTNKIQPSLSFDNFYQQQGREEIGGAIVSTELKIGNPAHHDRSMVQNNISTMLTVRNSSPTEPASSSNAASWNGGSSTKSTPFLLFGKAIDPMQSAKLQQPHNSSGSSSDASGHGAVSGGNQSEVSDKMHRFISGKEEFKHLETSSLRFHQVDSLDSTPSGVDKLNSYKEAGWFNRQKGDWIAADGFTHCKVFRENEDVGRTVDLSLSNSFEELYQSLAKMFGMEELEIVNRVVCIDSEGFPKHVGDEPYREFMKTAKRIKILSESSSESRTR